jgi:serine/threonine protein kinase
MSDATHTDYAADRNLLFGILAVEMDFVRRDSLIGAMHAWVLAKHRPLGEILAEQGALTPERRALLDAIVTEHLKAHGGDPQRSLAAVVQRSTLGDVAQGVADPDLHASLAAAGATLTTTADLRPAEDGLRYRVVRPHARGGLGVVSVAYDAELGREVALKEIQARYAEDATLRDRFVREAEITGGLEHPGVVPVYGLGRYADGRPYYAMRFIRGESLQDAADRFHRSDCPAPEERALQLRQLLRRFVDVCDAVAYAHSRGVLHRDLKPANVMLGPFGETLVVDWGLAKVIGHPPAEAADPGPREGTLRVSSAGSGSATRAGSALGTPAYMSPEQAAGRHDEAGPACDVYSLGATLYHVLAGRAPFEGGGVEVILQRVRRGDFPRPREANPLVAPPLEAVCLKAMARKPEDRYPSPRALADDLEHWLADEPVSAWQDSTAGWSRWGPYLSDRAWATVREDYSADGNAWDFLPHDLARSKAYRWGEDGIAGVCDSHQILCFALAFWNGKDRILKERLFGLTATEGNHGEDVKEYYFHLDNTPTHSYMKYLYKYPQAEFPYSRLAEENRNRGDRSPEFELLDTGVFDGDRYFDIFIEYAKEDPEDIVVKIEAYNRGPDAAPLHVLPHLWFRNTWAWGDEAREGRGRVPVVRPATGGNGFVTLVADSEAARSAAGGPPRDRLGRRYLYGPAGAVALFTDNETNAARVRGAGCASRSRYVKDAFHRHVVAGEDCLNPDRFGTKSALHYRFEVPPGGSANLVLRLCEKADLADPLSGAEAVIRQRRAEADDFYRALHPPEATEDEKAVQRQALAGLLWSKQSYFFDVNTWLGEGAPDREPVRSSERIRNESWRHFRSASVLTVPDKWEYPWLGAWDLAFQCVPLALVDPLYAKEQLVLLLSEEFQHPNGQIPSYEWDFSDLHPPVQAWAVWRVYQKDRQSTGRGDRPFLERCFHKLHANFAWWINKVDRRGKNVFEGGFLGLDNIAVFDRSQPLPGGGVLEQADATGWMGLFCLNLMRIALELARDNPSYQGMATTFFRYFTYVARALRPAGRSDYQLWDEEDGFFYDVLRYPDGTAHKLRVRSLVGLIPLFAVECLDAGWLGQFGEFTSGLEAHRRAADAEGGGANVVREVRRGDRRTYVLTLADDRQTDRLLGWLWNESEFMSPFGVRSLSKAHQARPYRFGDLEIGYEPGTTASKIKGGNSNWRGPVWFCTSFLLIDSLVQLSRAYPATAAEAGGPGGARAYGGMARELADRLIRLFTRDSAGRRPCHGASRTFQEDPHWRDYLLFYESFHGDDGSGVGASHETGWTALVASLIDEWRR